MKLGGRADEVARNHDLRRRQTHEARRIVENRADILGCSGTTRIRVSEPARVLLLQCKGCAEGLVRAERKCDSRDRGRDPGANEGGGHGSLSLSWLFFRRRLRGGDEGPAWAGLRQPIGVGDLATCLKTI